MDPWISEPTSTPRLDFPVIGTPQCLIRPPVSHVNRHRGHVVFSVKFRLSREPLDTHDELRRVNVQHTDARRAKAIRKCDLTIPSCAVLLAGQQRYPPLASLGGTEDRTRRRSGSLVASERDELRLFESGVLEHLDIAHRLDRPRDAIRP